MVALDVTKTSEALAVAGGYILLVGLVSYFIKEKLFLSEALLAVIAGIAFGPIAANIFSPINWVDGSQQGLRDLTFEITRIIIAVQVLFTGIALPKAYLWKERLSLFTLLFGVMTCAWFACGLLIWGLIPGLTFLESLIIGACVTPTDPVLANSICKGRFAEQHVPLHVRNIILAESGANDGLGYPFLYIGLYLILIHEPSHPVHSIAGMVGEWWYNIVFYEILLACVIGGILGYIARKTLRYAESKHLIDNENFLAFGVALTFFTLGVVGMLGSDDILACFIVGNSFTWDDWFRAETEDHAFQDVIDNLLNTSRFIPSLHTWQEAAFAGFFGPIGVGAVFYVQVALQIIPDDGSRERLRAVITPVVYFLVLTSVIVHGTTIPLGKSFQTARSLTLTRSSAGTTTPISRLPAPVPVGTVDMGAISQSAVTARSSLEMRPAVAFDLLNDGLPDAWPGRSTRPPSPTRDSRRSSIDSGRRSIEQGDRFDPTAVAPNMNRQAAHVTTDRP